MYCNMIRGNQILKQNMVGNLALSGAWTYDAQVGKNVVTALTHLDHGDTVFYSYFVTNMVYKSNIFTMYMLITNFRYTICVL